MLPTYLCRARLACLFLSVLFIGETNSFVPRSLLSVYGSMGSHHEEITKCALNEIAVEYLNNKRASTSGPGRDVNSSRRLRLDQRAELTYCLSQGAVIEMCRKLDLFCREYGLSMKKIVEANVLTDKEEAHIPYAHFDAETIYDSNKQLVAIKQAATNAMTTSMDYITARQKIGRLLHTVQDFYAHSNWVEMGNSEPNAAIGRNLDFGVDVSLPDDDTCQDCTQVDCVNLCNPFTSECDDYCFLPDTGCFTIPWTAAEVCGPLYDCGDGSLNNEKLTSGFEGDQNIQKPVEAGFRKCSHGGFRDSSSNQPALGGINKDTNSNLLSPHFRLHKLAADIAKQASVDILRDVWDLVGDEHFGRFLGILLVGNSIGSLVIAMDTTGSMSDEIAAARESAKMLADEVHSSAEPPLNYILSPFNDPSVGPLLVTTDVEEFKSEIDKLTANDGGDTPEMCLTGILDALEKCERNSLIFVYTDAPAKDDHLITQVISMANAKESKITFLLTSSIRTSAGENVHAGMALTDENSLNGEWQGAGSLRYDIYDSIAASSGGQVITTTDAEISDVSLDLINAEEISKSEVDLVRVALSSNPPDSTSSYNFLVDPTLDELSIRVSGSQITSMTLEPEDPEAPALSIDIISDLTTLKSWKVQAPPPGGYLLTINTWNAFTLSVTASSTFTASASLGILELAGHSGLFTIQSEPVAGANNSIMAELTGDWGDDTNEVVISYATLISSTWEPLSIHGLQSSGETLFTALAEVPFQPFRVLLNGTMLDPINGPKSFQRLQSTIFTPAYIDIVAASETSTNFIQINQGMVVSFVVVNHGSSPVGVSMEARDTIGLVGTVNPASATLPENGNVTVTVNLFANPSVATAGAITTLTMSASTTTLPAKSTNYATLSIIVMPEFIDSSPPSITIDSDIATSCDGVVLSACHERYWSATVQANDSESGLRSLIARNKYTGVIGPTCTGDCSDYDASFTVASEFEEGYNGIVEGTLSATCCLSTVELVAMDVAGNVNSNKAYVFIAEELAELTIGDPNDYGFLMSPNHPGDYPSWTSRQWRLAKKISSSMAALSTRLGFLRFRTDGSLIGPDGSLPRGDFVSFDYDDEPSEKAFAGDYQRKPASGWATGLPTLVTSNVQNVTVIFKSDPADTGSPDTGFLVAFASEIPDTGSRLAKDEPKRQMMIPQQHQPVFPAKNHIAMDLRANERRVKTDASSPELLFLAHVGPPPSAHGIHKGDDTVDCGFIMSPDHPANYPDEVRVSYEILVDEGKSVVIYPLRFNTEDGYDFVYLKDAAETNWELMLSGKDPIKEVWHSSKSNKAQVLFTSDSSGGNYGFLFAVAAVELN